jgi:endonuclease YncB( thermonuclease family)
MRRGLVRFVLSLLLCWTVTAEPGRVIDGDTAEMKVHKYLREYRFERVRLLGVQTPERGQPGYEDAKAFTRAWLGKGNVTLSFCNDDVFGRLLGTVKRGSEDLGQLLLEHQHAVPWAKGRR